MALGLIDSRNSQPSELGLRTLGYGNGAGVPLCSNGECAGLVDLSAATLDTEVFGIVDQEVIDAIARQVAFERIIGSVAATVRTFDAADPSTTAPGSVNFFGSVDRFDTLGEDSGIAEFYTQDFVFSAAVTAELGAVVVAPTYVSHELVIEAGAGVVTFDSTVGDVRAVVDVDEQGAFSLDEAEWCSDLDVCLPSLGEFIVSIEAADVSFGPGSQVFVNQWVATNSNNQAQSFAVPPGSQVTSPTDINNGVISLNFGGTNFDAERATAVNAPSFVTGGFRSSTAFTGFDSPVAGALPGSSTIVANIATSETSAVAGGTLPPRTTEQAASNREETNRENEPDNVASDRPANEQAALNECVGGAGATADTGRSEAHGGSATDIFSDCRGDFSGGSAGSP